MSTAGLMILLTWLSAETEAPEEPAEVRAPEPMYAAWGVSSVIYGHGRILEAQVVDYGVLRVRTAEGWTSTQLPITVDDNSFFSVEELRFAGNRIVVEIERYHDPCGCDDGPVWADTYQTTCRLVQGGRLRCTAPRNVYSYTNMDGI
jgi:hypothetical protein